MNAASMKMQGLYAVVLSLCLLLPLAGVQAGDREDAEAIAGSGWTTMAGGMSGSVNSLTVYDGRLVAGGGFISAGGAVVNRIAEWDGAQWLPFGTGADGGIFRIEAYGNRLVVSGSFDSIGGVTADGLARWNGSAWSSIPGSPFVSIDDMIVYNGDLIVVGTSQIPGAMKNIARWNGTTWSPLGTGLDSGVSGMGVHNGQLIVSADRPWPAVGRAIWSWNGSAWNMLEDQVNEIPYAFATWQGDLIAAGRFTSIGGVSANRIARWDGETWSPLGAGIGLAATNQRVESLAVYEGHLWAFGFFERAGGQPASHVARWDGNTWSTTGSGTDTSVSTAEVHAGSLYVGGPFETIDGVAANYIARRFADEIFAGSFE